MDVSYHDTLIAVAEDCPVTSSVVPSLHHGKRTVALIQYEMLAAHPYRYTSAEVLFESNMRHKGISETELISRRNELWDAFFSKPQACLRASPLPKRFGWGIHCDERGRVALLPMESSDYRKLATAKAVKVVKAMASARAR